MSGGSYDYMSREMEDGRTDKFRSYREKLVDDLNRLGAIVANNQDDYGGRPLEIWVLDDKGEIVRPPGQPAGAVMRQFTETERWLAAAAVGSAIQKVEHAKRLMDQLTTVLADLAPVASDIEWWISCDTSAGQCVDGLIAWIKEKAELL